jgi:hypothetical protein
LVAILLATAGLVALHHAAPIAMHDMPAAAMCLAVVASGVAVARGIAGLFLQRFALPAHWLLPLLWFTRPCSVPARAGPLYLRLAVLRR